MDEIDVGTMEAILGRKLMTAAQWSFVAEKLSLTSREQEVCERLFCGMSRSELATSMSISTHTVRTHMESIYSKLGVVSRIGVVLRIIDARDEFV